MCVYFITDDNNHVKIGVCSGDPTFRVKELQTGNPLKLRVYEKIETSRYKDNVSSFDLEKIFHEKFKDYRLEGEWFVFEPVKKYLDWLKNTCEKTPKSCLQGITNLICKFPEKDRELFIFGRYRTTSKKETVLTAEWITDWITWWKGCDHG